MKVQLIKQSSGMWKPATQEDLDALKKYPVFHKLQCDLKEAYRSIEEHRLFWAFFNFIYDNQSYEQNKDKFRAMLLLTLGYTEISYKKLGKGKYEEIEIPMSLRFDKMSQKKFHQLFKDLQQFAFDKMGISFDEWMENEIGYEGKCQNPSCHNPANHTHEIIPGNYRRQFCIKNKWQVRICSQCHDLSHSKSQNNSAFLDITAWEMLKIWCKVLKLDVDKVRTYLEAPSENELPIEEDV